MRAIAAAALLALISFAARADPVTIHAEGGGLTRDQAISKALIAAVEQATGVTVASQALATTSASSTSENGTEQARVVQETQDMIARSTNGRILSYSVDAVDKAPEGGLLASLSVQVEVFHPKGISNANRRRIAVMAFEVADRSSATGVELRDKLLESFTQTRRFAVVDRSNDQAYASEIALVTGPDANPAERARASQVLGADYVVTGHLVMQGARTTGRAAQTTSHVLEINGEVVTNTTPSTLRTLRGSLSVDYEVIEIATRQIKYAAHLDRPGQDFAALAQAIANRITNAIYPPRLVDISDPQAVVINQGGDGMSPGQRFLVMQEGHELFDPYSGESLGRKEAQVATIEISHVSERVSYAKVIVGSLAGDATSLVLRPLEARVQGTELPTAPRPTRRRATTRNVSVTQAPTQPDTGFRLPFDH